MHRSAKLNVEPKFEITYTLAGEICTPVAVLPMITGKFNGRVSDTPLWILLEIVSAMHRSSLADQKDLHRLAEESRVLKQSCRTRHYQCRLERQTLCCLETVALSSVLSSEPRQTVFVRNCLFTIAYVCLRRRPN